MTETVILLHLEGACARIVKQVHHSVAIRVKTHQG